MLQLPDEKAGFQRLGAVFLAAAVIVPILLLVVAAWRDYNQVTEQVHAEVENNLNILQQYVHSEFQTHEVIAKSVIAHINGLSWDEVQTSSAVHEFLKDLVEQFPQVHSVWISDGEGTARSTNLMFPVPFITAKSREYYHLLKNSRDPIVISGPFTVQAGDPVEGFNISFRISNPDGSLKGFIGTAIPTEYFRQIFRSFDTKNGPSSVSSLFQKDGKVLVRYPLAREGAPASYASDQSFMELLRDYDHFTYSRAGLLDNIERLYSYARLRDFPVYVGHGVGQDLITARWLANLKTYAIFVVVALTVLALLAAYGWRQHRVILNYAGNLENLVRDRTRHLKEAVDEKNAFFREVHHRVKNNLQIIVSLARLQEKHGADRGQLERRVQAMAMVHELLYSKPEATRLNLREYIEKLCRALTQTSDDDVKCTVSAEDAGISLERAVPFALILSEALTNAIKHATPERGPLELVVKLEGEDDHLVLTVKDNGSQLPPSYDNGSGFGMKLIKSLVVQLDGTAEFVTESGLTFRMRFPAKRS